MPRLQLHHTQVDGLRLAVAAQIHARIGEVVRNVGVGGKQPRGRVTQVLTLCEPALARQHHPDLILMDIQLPEVSGLEVTKWLKEDDKLKSIPVIAVTAFAMKGDEEKIREGGCEAYIAKPISVTNFLQTVERFID